MLHQLTYLILIGTLLNKTYYYYVHFKVEKTESQKGKNNLFEVTQKVTDPLCKLLRIISGIMLLPFVNKQSFILTHGFNRAPLDSFPTFI